MTNTNAVTPSCPKCGAKMVKRQSRTGKEFWGCPNFSKDGCRGTLSIDNSESEDRGESSSIATSVIWGDRVRREIYSSEYITVGSIPGVTQNFLELSESAKTLLSQSQFLIARRREPIPEHVGFVCSLIGKILQRGRLPLSTLGIEREALSAHGILDSTEELSEKGIEMGWEIKKGYEKTNNEEIVNLMTERKPFEVDPEYTNRDFSDNPLFDSTTEEEFFCGWIPKELGETAAHWFTPQASLDKLISRAGMEQEGNRRVDFLWCFPGSKPLAIEIDDESHKIATDVDRMRDVQLKHAGIDVCRVTNAEAKRGSGKNLDKIKENCRAAIQSVAKAQDTRSKIALVVRDCAFATKVQFAVVRAINNGWLRPGQHWKIKVHGAGTPAIAGIADVMDMLSGLDTLYGVRSAPGFCEIFTEKNISRNWRLLDTQGSQDETIEGESICEIQIRVESNVGVFHSTSKDETPDIIIRPAYLPVQLANEQMMGFKRQPVQVGNFEAALPKIEMFLQHIFRKCKFRQQQGESIYNILCHNDTIVLLPTGAGKSIIYQLAGLLMPGITLVIDPLIALISDQIEGMAGYGIDHTAKIVHESQSEREEFAVSENRKALLLSIERGENLFVLISPERMQAPKFQDALHALAVNTFVNLAVIDEAHCVSEWGHDFRPAYLNLADSLREYCKDRNKSAPPLLALTGTASRVVLRDMLRELDINENSSNSLFRPDSFDRKELTFEIHQASPDSSEAKLRGTLTSLPRRFGLPRNEFYEISGRDTNSGIVFVPTVNDKLFGIEGTARVVKKVTGALVATYSGSPPRGVERHSWEKMKRESARRFKANKVAVLVATKAFGMGIDKPNIRYTIHFGMPGTLENFYQEVGRAGRDGKPAHCTVIFTELDTNRSNKLLDSTLDLAALEQHIGSVVVRDDITRALWFHLQGFRGTDEEMNDIRTVLEQIGDIRERKICELGFWIDDTDDTRTSKKKGHEKQEHAICRLTKLGVVDRYAKDFPAKKFRMEVHKLDFEHYKKRLLEYIRRVQPAKGKMYRSQIEQISEDSHFDAILSHSKILVDFAYETIELSRRRMIQEAMLFARNSRDDGDIRRRILYYLQEGVGIENISSMADETIIDFEEWINLIRKAESTLEASDIGFTLGRELESNPSQPGLLLARAVLAFRCGDYGTCRNGLYGAFRNINDFELKQEFGASIESLFEYSRESRPELAGLSGLIAFILLNLSEDTNNFPLTPSEILKHSDAANDSCACSAVLAHKVRNLVSVTEKLTTRLLPAPLPPTTPHNQSKHEEK